MEDYKDNGDVNILLHHVTGKNKWWQGANVSYTYIALHDMILGRDGNKWGLDGVQDM